MKNEILMRAIGEIDDDLLLEAHSPLPRAHHSRILRYAAMAACFVFLAAAVLRFTQTTDTFVLSVNGIALSGETGSEDSTEIPLVAAMRQRSFSGSEIPLHVSVGRNPVILKTDDSGVLYAEDGQSAQEMTLSDDAELLWIIDVTAQRSFTLTVTENGRVVTLTAALSPDETSVVVTTCCD